MLTDVVLTAHPCSRCAFTRRGLSADVVLVPFAVGFKAVTAPHGLHAMPCDAVRWADRSSQDECGSKA
jgi:hypothetical protein